MGMADKMKEKAIPATSAKKSAVIVQRISRADVVELNRSMEPIVQQNEIEYRASSDAISKDSSVYGDNCKSKGLIKKLY